MAPLKKSAMRSQFEPYCCRRDTMSASSSGAHSSDVARSSAFGSGVALELGSSDESLPLATSFPFRPGPANSSGDDQRCSPAGTRRTGGDWHKVVRV